MNQKGFIFLSKLENPCEVLEPHIEDRKNK